MHVVRSLLETDLYKFTMWQALLHSHPGAHGEYEFRCRNEPAYPLAELKNEVEAELDHLCSMMFAEQEVEYLRSLRFIKSDFADFLTLFRFQRKFIHVETDGPHLRIRASGPIVHVMGFEIFVLYIVNELYFRRFDRQAALAEARVRLQQKIDEFRAFGQEAPRANPFEFFDFGVRRRFSGEWHDEVVATLARELPQYFKGTSNVYLARKYNLVPIGTMAHEYLQAHQAFGVRLRDFQKMALEDWVQEYRGAHRAQGPQPVPPLRRPGHDRLRHRHQAHQRHAVSGPEHRHEAGALQRPGGGETVRRAGEVAVHRRDFHRLPAPGLRPSGPLSPLGFDLSFVLPPGKKNDVMSPHG